MKKLILFFLICGYAFSQNNCELCVVQDGFYCGDDESNWTQYSPLGCVPNGLGGLFYLNDGWEDCVDGSDEGEAIPTPIEECTPPPPICDTIYVVEYLDCETGSPCYVGLPQLIKESKNTGFLYNLNGQVIVKPEGIYIENGEIKYNIK